MNNICFVTGNYNKLNEVKSLVKNFNIISNIDLNFNGIIPETENTLEGNSFLKSNFINNKFKINCFSDDSGLFIESLGGEPGVNSARYASANSDSEENMNLVLKKLENQTNRNALFETCICLIINNRVKYFKGSVKGMITHKKFGNSGFGYDPIFVPNGYSKTFAEMSINKKNKISHRSIAIKKLVSFLNKLY
tara:strand:- start:1585 stop:2163 length:579 start_codon:yes stop_codon:yes gene_type:complete